MVVTVWITISQDVMPCSMVEIQWLLELHAIHHILKMVTAHTSEGSVNFYRSARSHTPGDNYQLSF